MDLSSYLEKYIEDMEIEGKDPIISQNYTEFTWGYDGIGIRPLKTTYLQVPANAKRQIEEILNCNFDKAHLSIKCQIAITKIEGLRTPELQLIFKLEPNKKV